MVSVFIMWRLSDIGLYQNDSSVIWVIWLLINLQKCFDMSATGKREPVPLPPAIRTLRGLCFLHDLCWSEPEESINSFWGRVIHSPQRKPSFQFLRNLQNALAFGMAGSEMAHWWESGTLFKFVFRVQSPTPRRIPRVSRRRSYI